MTTTTESKLVISARARTSPALKWKINVPESSPTAKYLQELHRLNEDGIVEECLNNLSPDALRLISPLEIASMMQDEAEELEDILEEGEGDTEDLEHAGSAYRQYYSYASTICGLEIARMLSRC